MKNGIPSKYIAKGWITNNSQFHNIGMWFILVSEIWLFLHLRPNYNHSASNDIHTDGPRARTKARGYG